MRARLGPATAVLVLAGVLLGLVAGPASGAEGGTDRPFKLQGEVTTVLNLCVFPFPATIEGSTLGSHLGNGTSALAATIGAGPSPTMGTLTGSGTLTAANGDVLFVDFSGIITSNSPTDNRSITVFTITGGTGRFEDATGTFTVAAVGVAVSASGCTSVLRHTITGDGTISY